MGTWVKRVIFSAIATIVIYVGYDYYRADLHTRPEMPSGAFSLSYKSGLRAVLVGVLDERETRRYFGTPLKVPFYLEDAWSFCYPPSEEERVQAAPMLVKRNWPGERLDAICKLDVDGEEVVRGVITTVPKL